MVHIYKPSYWRAKVRKQGLKASLGNRQAPVSKIKVIVIITPGGK
jgi:hypothetical protein